MQKSLSQIDQKIAELKKKKEELQSKQALLLLRETQKILGDEFSPDLALSIISQSWQNATTSQKKEWMSSTTTFRKSSANSQHTNQKSVAANS